MAMELLSAASRRAPGAGGPVSELPPPIWKLRGPGGAGGDVGAEQKEAVVGDGVTGLLTPSENEMLWGRMRRKKECETAGHAGELRSWRARTAHTRSSHGRCSGGRHTALRITEPQLCGRRRRLKLALACLFAVPVPPLFSTSSVPHRFCHPSPEPPWHLGHPEVPWGDSGHWRPRTLASPGRGCRWAEPPLS